MSEDIDWQALRAAAHAVQKRAYAPYSRFHVGAALLTEDGRIFSGCNVENASYGLCLCAERNAVGQAVAAGVQKFRAIAIIATGDKAASPCGMCRQVLSEFPPSFAVRSYAETKLEPDLISTTMALLPDGFEGKQLPGQSEST